MKTLMTTSLLTSLATLLVAGSALMAQTGSTPAPAANSSSPASTTAPAKVKKHHHKAKTGAPSGSAVSNAAPASSAAPAKK